MQQVVRSSLVLLILGSVLALTVSPSKAQAPAQAPAQSAAVKECLRLDAQPADQIPWDQHERVYKQWAEVCKQALVTDGGDIRIKKATARALGASGQRPEEIVLLREMAAQNDAEAYFDIYAMFNSFYRHLDKPQLVKRAEAEQALRKAAQLGHPYSILMLAVLLDHGGTVKRDNANAIRWAERAVTNPDKDRRPADMQVLLGRLRVKSDDAAERARGTALLGKLAQAGRSDAKTELAKAVRATDPVQARSLLEQGLNGYAGGAIPPLAEMLFKGEGGPADPKRALSLLSGGRASDVPGVRGALGMLYIQGNGVPRDLKKGIDLFSIWAGWDYDARLQLMKLLADNPELTITRPEGILYDAAEAAELGEPGAVAALINLKLSQSAQFRDEAGGCKLVMAAAKARNDIADKHQPECNAIASYDSASVWYEKNEFDRAITDYSAAIKLNPKYAGAYIGRGISWYAKKDYDRAIADYDEAIRIDPKYPLGYVDRGLAWVAKKNPERAITDYDEAIRIDPKYTDAYDKRGYAWQSKGNLDRAIADYSEAIRIDPKYSHAFGSRGRAHFYRGNFAGAAADLLSANSLNNDAYSMLWLFLARGRAGKDGSSELSDSAARLKTKNWPYPVVEFYLGRRPLGTLREAAINSDQKCEAEFYGAEWDLLHDNKSNARTALQAAVDRCPKTFFEYFGAVSELKRLEN